MLEKGRIDVEAIREPGDRLRSRPSLAPFDLTDVLLREPSARELGLCQAGRNPQLSNALTKINRAALALIALNPLGADSCELLLRQSRRSLSRPGHFGHVSLP